MSNFISRLTADNKFLKNVMALLSATVIAQLCNVIFMPILSRLYSPEDFGVQSLYLSVVALLATVAGCRYYLIIPMVRRRRYVDSIIWLTVILQIIFAISIALIICMFKQNIQDTPYSVLLPYWPLIPIGIIFISNYFMLTQWAIREKEFVQIGKTKLIQVAGALCVNVSSALLNLKPVGLLLGAIVGQSLGGTTLLKILINKQHYIEFKPAQIKRVALVYRKMFLFDTPGAFLDASGAYMLPIIMAYFFSTDVVGAFSMAQNLLVLPGVLIGNAIGQVFTQRAAEAFYNGTLESLVSNVFELLFRLGVFPIMMISILAPFLLPLILGKNWSTSGYFASILGSWIALNFIYSPLSALFTILMLQKLRLVFVLLYTSARLLSVVVAQSSPTLAIVCLSASGTIMMLYGICLLLNKAGISLKTITQKICLLMGEIVLSIMPVIYISYFLSYENKIILLLPGTVVSCIIYAFFSKKSFYKLRKGKI